MPISWHVSLSGPHNIALFDIRFTQKTAHAKVLNQMNSFTKKSKWVWSGNTRNKHCRPTHGTMRHQEDNLSIATSSLFPIKSFYTGLTRVGDQQTHLQNHYTEIFSYMSGNMRFPTMWYVRPTKAQTSLRRGAVWSEPLPVACHSMSFKLLSEQHFGFLSLKGVCTGSSESIHVKMSHSWKSQVAAYMTGF